MLIARCRAANGGESAAAAVCKTVTVLIDGVEIPEGERKTLDLDRWLRSDENETVEFYSADRVPVQFLRPGSTRGIVLFWTRGAAPAPKE